MRPLPPTHNPLSMPSNWALHATGDVAVSQLVDGTKPSHLCSGAFNKLAGSQNSHKRHSLRRMSTLWFHLLVTIALYHSEAFHCLARHCCSPLSSPLSCSIVALRYSVILDSPSPSSHYPAQACLYPAQEHLHPATLLLSCPEDKGALLAGDATVTHEKKDKYPSRLKPAIMASSWKSQWKFRELFRTGRMNCQEHLVQQDARWSIGRTIGSLKISSCAWSSYSTPWFLLPVCLPLNQNRLTKRLHLMALKLLRFKLLLAHLLSQPPLLLLHHAPSPHLTVDCPLALHANYRPTQLS